MRRPLRGAVPPPAQYSLKGWNPNKSVPGRENKRGKIETDALKGRNILFVYRLMMKGRGNYDDFKKPPWKQGEKIMLPERKINKTVLAGSTASAVGPLHGKALRNPSLLFGFHVMWQVRTTALYVFVVCPSYPFTLGNFAFLLFLFLEGGEHSLSQWLSQAGSTPDTNNQSPLYSTQKALEMKLFPTEQQVDMCVLQWNRPKNHCSAA